MKIRWLPVIVILLYAPALWGQTMADFEGWPKGVVSIDTTWGTPRVDFRGWLPGAADDGRPVFVLGNESVVDGDTGTKYWPADFYFAITTAATANQEPTTVLFAGVRGIKSIRMLCDTLEDVILLKTAAAVYRSRFSTYTGGYGLINATLDSFISENDTAATLMIAGSRVDTIRLSNLQVKTLVLSDLEADAFFNKEAQHITTRITSLRSANSTYDSVSIRLSPRVPVKQLLFSENRIRAPLVIDSVAAHVAAFHHCRLGGITWTQLQVTDSLSLAFSRLEGNSKLSGTLSGPLNLQGLELDEGVELDLRGLSYDTLKGGRHRRIPVNFLGVEIEMLHLEWANVMPDWRADASDEVITKFYQDLLENFKKRGQLANLELADKEYRHYANTHAGNVLLRGLGHCWDWLQLIWWDYGYKRWLAVFWTIGLPFLLALLLRYRNVLKMHREVYEVDNFSELLAQRPPRHFWQRYGHKLVYASVVFFALNVKFEKLKYGHTGLLLRFVLIYLAGIWCLFFIVNFLLKA